MSDTSIIAQRNTKTGRFLAGNNGGARKPGSRNKLFGIVRRRCAGLMGKARR
jgi:hypothetical protein